MSIGTDTLPGQYKVKISVADTLVKGGRGACHSRNASLRSWRRVFGIILTGLGYDKVPQALLPRRWWPWLVSSCWPTSR